MEGGDKVNQFGRSVDFEKLKTTVGNFILFFNFVCQH